MHSVSRIMGDIQLMLYEIKNPRNDGYYTFGLKQDLYLIKELVDRAIAESPTYVGEEEWLQEREKERIIKILKS